MFCFWGVVVDRGLDGSFIRSKKSFPPPSPEALSDPSGAKRALFGENPKIYAERSFEVWEGFRRLYFAGSPATLTSPPFAAAGNKRTPGGFTLGMEKGLGGLLPSHVQSHRGLEKTH